MNIRFWLLTLMTAAVLAGCSSGDGSKELEAGKNAYGLRDLVKAAKCFEKCLELAPDNVDALVYLARTKLEVGELEASGAAVRRALNLEPQAVDARLLAAQLAWHAKDYERAYETYHALAADDKLDASVRSQAWTGLGIVEVMREEPHLARLAYLRAIRLDRRNAAAWYHLGRLYRDGLGYLEAALEQFEFYVRIEKDADVKVQKVQRSVIPALKQSLNTALMQRPGVAKRDSAAASDAIARGEAAVKKGAYKTAKKEYETALAADPISYPAALGLARTLERIDAKAALEKYRLACQLSPSAVSTYVHTGTLAAKLGMHGIAEMVFSRAVAANPASLDALDGLIRALRKNGKPKLAQAYQQYRDTLPVRKRK